MPSEIVSAVTEPPAPTARGMGQIAYLLFLAAIAEAGKMVNEFDPILLDATARYAPERFPGAFPELTITLTQFNRAFKFTVTDVTGQTFGGSN
jgi:hypothetical protein